MADDTKIIRIIIDSSKAVDGSAAATRALRDIEKQGATTSDILSKIQQGFDTAAALTKITVLGYGVKELTSRLQEMWSTAREAATAIQDLSDQLGVSTTFVQASEFAAASNTVSIEKMSQGYTKASQIIGQAAQGQKAAVDLMNALGVNILDAAGKLRSTETVLSDSAAAILKVEDPAKRVALAMDLFGKSGAQLIPMLKDLAAGQDVMASKAAAAGAMIEQGILKQVAELTAHAEQASLKWNALVLNIGTPIATAAMEAVDRILGSILGKLREMDAARASADQGVLPQNEQDAVIANYNRTRALALNPANKRNAFIQNSYSKASQAFENMTASAGSLDNVPDADERARILREQNAVQLAISGTFPVQYLDPAGKSNPPVAGAGDDLAKRIARMMADAQIALTGASAGAFAAGQGPNAVDQLETHYKDLKDVADAFIKSGEQVKLVFDAQTGALTTNNAAVNANVAALDKLNESTRVQNNLKAFGLQNFNLKQDNDNLALQINLTGQTTEEISRQVDLRKAYNDEQAKGLIDAANGNGAQADAARQAIADRTTQIDKQYELKTAIDQTAKSTQLWLQPFTELFSGIQQDFEQFFESVINTGKVTWQSLTDALKATFVKTLAELATLALVRPVIVEVVQSVFSPGAAQQMGYGGGANSGLGAIFGSGSGGGIGLPGGGGGSGLFGGFGDFLNTPIGGFGGALTGDSPAAIAAFPGATGLAAPGLGGLTYGGALGGIGSLAGIGTGIYGLANSNGSAGSLIGSAGSILGGGLGLASLLPGMAALGPWGIGIGLGAMVLSSVLGGGGPKIPPMPGLNYGQGTLQAGVGQTVASGDYASAASSIGQAVQSLITASGGSAIASRLYGGTVATGANHTWDGTQWVASPYSQANITSPTGETSFIGGTGQGVSLQDAADALAAAIFRSDVLTGAIKGLGPTLAQVLAQNATTKTADLQNIITMSKLFDSFQDPSLANNITAASQAFDQIKASMANLMTFAQQYGLDTSVVTNAQSRQEIDYAKAFGAQFDTSADPMQAQIDALEKQKQQAIKEATYLNTSLQGVSAPVDLTTNSTVSSFLANPNLTDSGATSAYINAIYGGTFGRTADAGGLAYWQGQLSSGALTPGQLINAIRGGAQGGDINAANTVGIETYTVDINKITESFLKQEAALREQYYSQSLSSLENTIKRLTLGDLSTASPGDVLSGTKATYAALLAQAKGGDINAANALGGAASDYATAGQSYYASSTDYQNLKLQILSDLASVYQSEGGSGQATVTALSTISQQLASGTNDNAQTNAQIASLVASVQLLTDAINRQMNAA